MAAFAFVQLGPVRIGFGIASNDMVSVPTDAAPVAIGAMRALIPIALAPRVFAMSGPAALVGSQLPGRRL